MLLDHSIYQRVESRTHGSRPRPRTALPRTDTLEAKDRNTRGQGQGPRKQTQMCPKKKGLKKIFLGDLKKKVFKKMLHTISSKNGLEKIFSADLQIFNRSKNSAVLDPRTGQFSRTWGFEAKAENLTFEAKAKDFKMCLRGRPRGQGRPRRLHLWCLPPPTILRALFCKVLNFFK